MNLIAIMQDQMGPMLSSQASALLGLSANQASQSVSKALPALLGGVISQAKTAEGAASVFGTLTSDLVETNLSANLDFEGKGLPITPGLVSSGEKILKGLVGDKAESVTQGLASLTNLDSEKAGNLMGMVAPFFASKLKGVVSEKGLDLSGFVNLLGSQSEPLTAALGAGNFEKFGFGGFGDLFGGLQTASEGLKLNGGSLAAGAAALTGLAGANAEKLTSMFKTAAEKASGTVEDASAALQATGDKIEATYDASREAINEKLAGDLPEVSAADVKLPEVSAPGVNVSEFNSPALDTPDIKVPDISAPDIKVPDISAPDIKIPDVSAPDIKVPDVSAPEVKLPKVDVPDVQKPDLKIAAGTATEKTKVAAAVAGTAAVAAAAVASTKTPKPTVQVKNHQAEETKKGGWGLWKVLPILAALVGLAWLLSTCTGPKSEMPVASTAVDTPAPTVPAVPVTDAAPAVAEPATATTEAPAAPVVEATVAAEPAPAVETPVVETPVATTEAPMVDTPAVDAPSVNMEAPTVTGALDTADAAVSGTVDAAKDLLAGAGAAVTGAVETGKEMTANSADAVMSAVAAVKEVALPDGTQLSLSEGSPVDQILTYLQSDSQELPKAFILRGLNFETASARITAESAKITSDLASTLKAYPAVNVKLEGHTDSRGKAENNLSLSASRAASVRDALVAKGIDASRMATAGFGSDRPIADNGSEEGRLENRRVEVIITEK